MTKEILHKRNLCTLVATFGDTTGVNRLLYKKRMYDNRDVNIWCTKLAYSRTYRNLKETYKWRMRCTYLLHETCVLSYICCDERHTYIYDKSDAHIWQTKLWYYRIYVAMKDTYHDKRDTHLTNKTCVLSNMCCDERDLYIWQKRCTCLTNKTCILSYICCDERDTYIWYKRCTFGTNETCSLLWWPPVTPQVYIYILREKNSIPLVCFVPLSYWGKLWSCPFEGVPRGQSIFDLWRRSVWHDWWIFCNMTLTHLMAARLGLCVWHDLFICVMWLTHRISMFDLLRRSGGTRERQRERERRQEMK